MPKEIPRFQVEHDLPRRASACPSVGTGLWDRLNRSSQPHNPRAMHKYWYGLFAILGLSFWFLLGFPFGHHNESYVWAAELAGFTFMDSLTHKLGPVANLRPLGQSIAWITYKASGNLTWCIQIFNFVVAAMSWLLVTCAIAEKKVMSALAVIVNGCLFSGYIYLFHLHGVFYSPLLLLIAILFIMYEGTQSSANIGAVFLVAIVTSLFHPYALLIYFACTLGLCAEKRNLAFVHRATMATLLVATLLLIISLAGAMEGGVALAFPDMLFGWVTSYRMIEVSAAVSIVTCLLCLATTLSLPWPPQAAVLAVIVTIAGLLLLMLYDLPFMIGWIIICTIKMASMRKLWIASLIVVTSLLPMPSPTGSPTYVVFVIMVSAIATAYGWSRLEARIKASGGVAALVCLVVTLGLACALRLGARVPVITKLANPLLAEREKTKQLERIIGWLIDSEYRDAALILQADVSSPSRSSDAIDRTHRAPAGQDYINKYLDALRPQRLQETVRQELIVCFGIETFDRGKPVYIVDSAHAGSAVVYLRQK